MPPTQYIDPATTRTIKRNALSIGSYTHTHPFNGPSSRTTQVSRYQKGKSNLDFTGTRDSEWQWHQLGHMQVCTALQTDNHASTPTILFTGRMPFLSPNQQRQSNEGTSVHTYIHTNLYSAKNREDVQQSIDIAWRPGPQQQTRCSGVQWPDGTDRQTDGQTLESCVDPSSHTMRTVSK